MFLGLWSGWAKRAVAMPTRKRPGRGSEIGEAGESAQTAESTSENERTWPSDGSRRGAESQTERERR